MNFIQATVAVTGGALRAVHPSFAVEVTGAAPIGLGDGDACLVGIRPEDVRVAPAGEGIAARVYATEPLGGETVVDLKLGDRVVKALAPPTLELAPDAAVGIVFDSARIHLFTDAGSAALSAGGNAGVFRVTGA